MSKLDDILKETSHNIAVGVATGEWKGSDTKQQIKDLMGELIKEVEKPAFGKTSDKLTKLKKLVNEL